MTTGGSGTGGSGSSGSSGSGSSGSSGSGSGSGSSSGGSGSQTSQSGTPGNSPDEYTDNYSGFGRVTASDPGEGDNGFARANLPFGVRPSSPVNRDMNGYAQTGQSAGYLGNPDAAGQADNVTGKDIDGLELPSLQQQRQETWDDYAAAQAAAAAKGDGSGVGSGG